MTNIIDNLFKRRRSSNAERDMSSLTKGLAQPAVQLIVQAEVSRSHFGGSPDLPADVAWPETAGKRLAFLARVALSDVHRVLPVDWLPGTGDLLFFYDMEQQPWGFDPKDRGGWAVLHVPDINAPNAPSATQLSEESPFPHRYIGFRRIESFPSYERETVTALNLTDGEADKYEEFSGAPFQGAPRHQISGFPTPVQGDGMELECQLVSNGLYCGDSTGYHDARASTLESGATDWRLLFQFDSDDELDVMWGDCGTVYYWVREQSALSGDFSNAWLVLQCS